MTKQKKSSKKEATKVDMNAVTPPTPANLQTEEILGLRLVYSELEKSRLQIQVAQQLATNAQLEVKKYVDLLNDRYSLDPTKDSIDLITGLITRGSRV